MATKKQIRRDIRERIGAMTAEQRLVADAHIATSVTHLPGWQDAEIVVAYVPMDDEVDITAVLQAAFRSGKRVVLPRVEPEGTPRMTMRIAPTSLKRWEDVYNQLEAHPYGLRQPPGHWLQPDYGNTTLMLVPGRGFDRRGNRVGRGAGYYDGLLADLPGGVTTVGVGYAVQLFRDVPADDDDVQIQIVVTDLETCFCKRTK